MYVYLQSILELAERLKITEKEEGLLDRLMEHGRLVTVKVCTCTCT